LINFFSVEVNLHWRWSYMTTAQWLTKGEAVNKRPSASPLHTPVLIADKNPSMLEAIASVLRRSMPGIALSLCPSHSFAMHSLSTARYQVVLCGAEFAGVADFMLLKQHRTFQQAVPFLVVAEGQDRDLVKSALKLEGIEDIVVWPLLKNQLEESLQHAMCLYQTRLTMAHRQQRLHALYRCQSLPQKHTRAAIRQIEANLKDLSRLVNDCEREAQERTMEHLDLLGRCHGEVRHT
jgi:DNA-binding NtrC family response regulator